MDCIGLEHFTNLNYEYNQFNRLLKCCKYNSFTQKNEIVGSATVAESQIKYPKGIMKHLNLYIEKTKCPFHERCVQCCLKDAMSNETIDKICKKMYILDIKMV
jgi:hypothetical protein